MNNFAITSAGIGEALQRSAAALAESGNSLDESIALVTAGNAVIQNPEQVGTALKTLALRLRSTKVELEEAGEDVDGMAESTSQLQAKLKALTGGKVDIMLTADSYKNPTEILREMASAWKDMSDIERSGALELMGGKRQANILASIINNFETVEDVIETSMNSSGSAMAENEKWLDSIEGKTYQFTNALQTMWSNMLDSEVIKGFIGFGTEAIQFLDTGAGKVIALVTALKLMAKFKGFSIGGIVKGLGDTINKITTAQQTLQTLSQTTKLGKGYDLTNVNAYAQAVSNLTAKQQANLLASQGLNQEQIRYALTLNQVDDAAMREAMAHVHAASAKDQEVMSGNKLVQQKAVEVAASLKVQAAKDGETRSTELNAAADILEQATSEDLTRDKLVEIMTSKGISSATQAEILAKLGLTNANKGLAASIKALYVLNPVGFWITVGSTILSLIPIVSSLVDSFTKSAKEIKEEANEISQTYSDVVNEVNSNLQTLGATDSSSTMALEKEFATLTAGVDRYGNNLSLTSDEYERYREICEQIVDINPRIASGYDSATEAIGNNASALSDLIKFQKEQARLAAEEYVNDENLETLTKDEVNDYNDAQKKRGKEVVGKRNELFGMLSQGSVKDTMEYILRTLGYGEAEIANKISKYYLNEINDYDSNLFIMDFIDEIDKKYKNFDGHVDALDEFFDEYENTVKAGEQSIEEAQDGLIDKLLIVPTSDKNYDKLTSEGKNFLNDWIRNNEIFKMDESTTAKDVQGMRDTIYKMIDILVSEAKTIEYNGKMIGAQDLLSKLYNLDPSTINYEEYKTQINAMLQAFWNSLSQDQKDQYGFTDFENFKISFGFDFETEENEIETVKNQVAGFLDMSTTEIQKKLDGMSAKEVKAFYSIDWNAVGDDGVDTWQDVVDKIQTRIGNDSTVVKTYSVLMESVEGYKDILTQTSEIVADNTEVSQEYKDSLTDLGISQEDLNECFDDANPLIVKNAKALNKLVKEANKNVAANVKLAKSNARLDYYKLVKQLNDTMNGTKKLDAATRNSIYSTLEQIDAVEKALYQYQLLEDALLGVNNAFDEFAEAQEIDSLNTYGDSYVEMAQTMYDALYKTGQVGTEAFWSSVEALVPTEVYQHLTDDADRMKAIYDYYNKNILPSLKLDEDELSLDYEAIEEFVEDGLEAGVFKGDKKNFDLVEGMNLEKAAELMGMTKTQAYALFAELDKYNTAGNEHSFLSQLDDSLEGRITNITNDLEDLNRQKLELLESKPEVSEEVKSELERLGEGGSVDLTLRPVIDSSELINAGWEEQAGEIATVFTSTFSNEAGNVAINFTPIVADENGNYIRTLSPEELQKYAEEVIAGVREDDLNLQIGAAFKGEDAIQQAEDAAEYIHELHEEYYIFDDDLNELNNKISKNEAELRKLGQEAYNTWQEYTKNDAAIAALSEIEDKTALLSEEGAKTLGLEWDEVKGQTVQQALDTLLAKQLELGEPTVLTAQLAIDNIDSQIAALKQKLKDSEQDPAVLGVEADADQTTIDEAKKKIEDQIQALEEDKVVLATEFGIELTEEEKKTVEDELNAIEKIVIHDKEFTVIANGTSETMQALNNINDYTLKNKSYTVTETRKFVGGGGGHYAQNMVRVDGTAHANGSWGAPRTETALVGELGPEMLVRNGRWTTVGDNGAEFTQIKKGDIIFNHRQTEDLLSKGYVTGRGKLKGGSSAFASGTAYSGLWKPTSPEKSQSNKPGDDFSGSGQKLYDAADSLSSAADDISSSASDSADEFREVFDWIEVRLEEIDNAINLKSAKLENKVGHKAQNKVVDDIIELNQNLYDNLIAGSKKYYSYANKLLSKVPAEYRDAAKDGTIAIETFVGEADEKTLEAIQEYREWVQKGDEATQRAEETLTEISNLAKQAIDNISQDYENKTSLRDNKIDQYEAYNSLLETDVGFESASIYQAMIKENNKNISTLEQQRNKMQEELNKRVESGEIKVGSQDWYDAINDIAAVDTEIINLKTDTENWQDAINELHWEKFDALMSRIEAVSNEAENLIDILSNEDMVDANGNWTDEGITTLGLYAQQMEAAEVQAKKYEEEIDYLNKNWQKLGYTEEEYLEKLDELKDGQYDAIKAYHDSKDAIVDLNKERIDAIKEGIEKEIEAYEELIDKKKEELDAEKDLYDFHKSVMEQEKDIADIQRQLAALSGDNSASARAKRAQLEAELAEAQAALEESYYERSIQNQQEALDKELENFQEEKNQEMEGLDEYLENTEQVVAESLATVQANTDVVYQTLQAMGQEYSLSVTESLTSPWKEGENAIQSFSEQFGISMSATVEELMELELQFKETMLEIEQAGADAVNAVKENAQGYTEAEYKEPKKEEKKEDKKTEESKTIKVGGKINAKGAKIYEYAGDKSGSKQYYSKDPIYVVLGEQSGYLKVRHHKSKSGVTGWFKKSDVKAYAKGSMGVNKDQWALIDELGDELQLIPGENGRLAYVKKGTGIVPADLTERLVNLAMDPQEMLDRNRPSIGAHPEINHTEISIDNSIGELIHIDNCSTETLPDIKKIVNDALEKHTQKLNQSLRRYTR